MPVRPPAPAASRGPVRLELDWDALEIAVERNSPDTDSYLDLTTGRVITITTGDPEAALNRQQVSENIRNFLRVEPASSREQYRWMEKFVGSVTDEALRERLIISIDGKGAFRRFKDVLMTYGPERERWFSFRSERLRIFMEAWLGAHALNPVARPLWVPEATPEGEPAEGSVVAAPRDEAPRETRRGKSAESLRKSLRDIAEALAPRDLDTLVSFAEFLKARRAARSFAHYGDSHPTEEEPPASQEIVGEPRSETG